VEKVDHLSEVQHHPYHGGAKLLHPVGLLQHSLPAQYGPIPRGETMNGKCWHCESKEHDTADCPLRRKPK